jgi:uncharacterized protein YjbI with pentapeptide repeats
VISLDKKIEDHERWLKGEGGVRANFDNAFMNGANIENVDLSFASFRNTKLNDSTFENVSLFGANFENAMLNNIGWSAVDIKGCNFKNAQMKDAEIIGIDK